MKDAQEKVKSPTTRVASDIRSNTAIKPAPSLTRVYVTQCQPDTASDTTTRCTRRYLKLDFEQVERVHAEHRDRPRSNTRKRVVLPNKNKNNK